MRPLAGRHVVTTRDQRGRLDSLLARAGADVMHVPLIEIGDPADGGVGLADALAGLDTIDWLVVTSHHGARRVGEAAAAHPELRLAAVGSHTAAVLAARAGRSVDLVPDQQTAAALASAFPDDAGTVLVAQADRAAATLVEGLVRRGCSVRAVTAYSTILRDPTPAERLAMLGADAVALASGSAAEAWVSAVGTFSPPVVAAIGPTTAAAAARHGLKVTHIAPDHDVEGLVRVITSAFQVTP